MNNSGYYRARQFSDNGFIVETLDYNTIQILVPANKRIKRVQNYIACIIVDSDNKCIQSTKYIVSDCGVGTYTLFDKIVQKVEKAKKKVLKLLDESPLTRSIIESELRKRNVDREIINHILNTMYLDDLEELI